MKLCGLQKLTLLDFPGHTACTVFTGGCNLRCPFCHNASLVTGRADALDMKEFFAFLKKRQGLLDGVCISGGEPLLHNDICDFAEQIRNLGYKIKLDTNGTLPTRLKEMLDKKLVDYVAMDLKNAPTIYSDTVGTEGFDFTPVAESMELLRASGISYEYRTTVVKPLHDADGLCELAKLIKPDETWFLQQFTDSGDILGSGMSAYSPEEMRLFAELLKEKAPSASLRGL